MLLLKLSALFLCIIAAVSDIRSYKVPNILLIVFSAAGLAEQGILFGKRGLLNAAGAVLLVFLLLGWLFLFRMLGAGDIKLFAVCGIYTGAKSVLYLMLFSFIFAGIYALARMAGKGSLSERFQTLTGYVRETLRDGFAFRKSYRAGQAEEHRIFLALFIFLAMLLWIGGAY